MRKERKMRNIRTRRRKRDENEKNELKKNEIFLLSQEKTQKTSPRPRRTDGRTDGSSTIKIIIKYGGL